MAGIQAPSRLPAAIPLPERRYRDSAFPSPGRHGETGGAKSASLDEARVTFLQLSIEKKTIRRHMACCGEFPHLLQP
jgi:hypothetical protein